MLVLIENSKVVNVAPLSRRGMAEEWRRQGANREVVVAEVAT